MHPHPLRVNQVNYHHAEGIARVTSLLRALPKRTVLLTSQADSATAHLFDVVDKVVKGDVGSGVVSASEIDDVDEDVPSAERA